ncbi:hypothetical protein [Streptomyces akebiae]|uniref:Transposase n=1 Tax=Streptomyces akebiae TaxID=2865673 RepID=A0ABX8XLZ9_9ACTN|nr:hypothetical protein [Streptomyces akebiae]QYX76633.1 hypothetical protein K1J60_09035 [Streptomyces akebiae]
MRLAPTPTQAALLLRTPLQAALKHVGRKRGINAYVEWLREVFRADWAYQPPLVEHALGKQVLTLRVQRASRAVPSTGPTPSWGAPSARIYRVLPQPTATGLP